VGSDSCRIAPNAEGEHEILCTPAFLLYPSDANREEPPMNGDDADHEENRRALHFGFTPSSERANMRGSGSGRRLYDDSGATVDIMVVWTKAAECGTAGKASPCTLNAATEQTMRGLIDLSVAYTNVAFNMSGALTQLRLVHAYRDEDYIESTTGGQSTDLSNLQNRTDGKLDGVHIKRALYGADVVAMIAGTEPFAATQCH
jgi:hypothetical protein